MSPERVWPDRWCRFCQAQPGEPCTTYKGREAVRSHSERVAAYAPDEHGNRLVRDGVERCECGCKYWAHDRCEDCGARPPAKNWR